MFCQVKGFAQEQISTLRIPRTSRPPRLEDFLGNRPRQAEVRVRDFRQFMPGDGNPVSQETSAFLSYDDKNLYAVFVCKEEPDRVRARRSKREDIWDDDKVAIWLDTFHDRQRAYGFVTNPLGIQLDGIHTERTGEDYSFDTLWHSEGRLTEDGYIVWIAIPFKSLRFPDASVQTWGIALGREIAHSKEESYWPFLTMRIAGLIHQLGTLEGIEEVSPGRNVQLIPYGAFAGARFLDRTAPAFRNVTEGRGGLDAKLVLHNALTFDIALNPDFSQVESDEPQVTANQRYEVFFPEKRPFFIENADFFRTRENLFFSRRIADPQFGVRLTGKMGRWGIGALVSDDRAPGRRVPEDDLLRGRRAEIGVVRVQRDFAAQSSIGVLVTSRDFASSFNRVVSLDTRIGLTSNWILSAQVMRSYTRRLDRTRRSGPAYFAELSRRGRHFTCTGRYTDRSPDFRSELGFIPRVDIRQAENSASYLWRPKGRSLLSFGPSVSSLVNWDRKGRLQDWTVNPSFQLSFDGPTNLTASRTEAFELYQGIGFRESGSSVRITTKRLKWMSTSASYSQGRKINFFPAAGLTPFLANSNTASLQLGFRPIRDLRWDLTQIYDRLGLRDGWGPVGQRVRAGIFTNHMLRSKVNYQFTRELSLRTIIDYNAVFPNSSLVALERVKRFAADVLVTCQVNPGTALYAGYTNAYENLVIAPWLPPVLSRTASPTSSTGRQVFFKVSYLLRF